MSRPSLRYEPVPFDRLAGWSDDNHEAALSAFRHSCRRLAAIPFDGRDRLEAAIRSGLVRVATMLDDGGRHPAGRGDARALFEHGFVPCRIVHDEPDGLLTGYFEPVLAGSREPRAEFSVALYRRPPELVDLVDPSQRQSTGKGLTHVRRRPDGGFEPFPTRRQIEEGALAGRGLELVHLADPVDAFIVHVQGSAAIRLADGSLLRIGYDGKNGHPYSSVGRHLIEAGAVAAADMTLETMAAWLRNDRERGQRAMWHNASFVFFRELTGEGGVGAQGVHGITLTAGRSLAVDASLHALGLPVYVAASGLRHAGGSDGFCRLLIAQDVGSAIRGPERGDIYFGSGPEAGRLAGITKARGNLFVLLPREAIGLEQSERRP
jgi:membrane-bound lytic murein transglycosylase A